MTPWFRSGSDEPLIQEIAPEVAAVADEMTVTGLLLHAAGVQACLPAANLDSPIVVHVVAVNNEADLLGGEL